jgi:hypothetical protein
MEAFKTIDLMFEQITLSMLYYSLNNSLQ